jgi:hypothetical protein
MIATRLSSVWQVAGVAAAALCCYLVSQTVAAERAGLSRVDARIADTRDAITGLETELRTRSKQKQLDSWNQQALALVAPKPEQFVNDGAQLVALHTRNGRPALPLDRDILDMKGDVSRVAYSPAPAAAPPPPTPAAAASEIPPAPVQMLRTAAFVRPKPQRLAAEAPAIERVAYKPAAAKTTLASLLPADIAGLAAAERGKGSQKKADR